MPAYTPRRAQIGREVSSYSTWSGTEAREWRVTMPSSSSSRSASVRRVDLSASCTFERPDGKPVALQAQVINVGSNATGSRWGGYLSQNQPRRGMVSLSADFVSLTPLDLPRFGGG